MRNMDRVIFGCLLVAGLAVGSSAMACTTDGWLGGASGGTQVGSPTTISRVSELCALKLAATGHVQDNNPAHTRMIARFYVWPQLSGTGTADVFVAYDNEAGTGPLFKVSFDGTNFIFDATDAGGGSGSAAAVSGWNLVEVDYNSDSNTFSYWLNSDATSDSADGSFASGAGTVQAVQLGLPNGLGGLTGSASFDSYESHSTTPVGPLLIGDANADDTVNIFDYSAVQQDILGNLQMGQPDCNLDGSVNIFDYSCIQQVILGG